MGNTITVQVQNQAVSRTVQPRNFRRAPSGRYDRLRKTTSGFLRTHSCRLRVCNFAVAAAICVAASLESCLITCGHVSVIVEKSVTTSVIQSNLTVEVSVVIPVYGVLTQRV